MRNNDKFKVLQFTLASSLGGRSRYILRNWKYIDRERFHFDFITFSKELNIEQTLIDEGCRVYHISCYPKTDRQRFIEEFDAILDNKYDAIHIMTSAWDDTVVEERAKEKGIEKIIIHAVNAGVFTGEKIEREKAIERHNLVKSQLNTSIATDYLTCSDLATEWLFGNKIPKERIKKLKIAIDIDDFTYNEKVRKEYRKRLNLDGCFAIGHVGRFAYQKNHEFLIKVFYEVSRRINNAKLLLMGGGSLKDDIKNMVLQLKLQNKVIFVNTDEKTENLMQAMDVFCLPSRFEGLPAVLVEAQAAGLKCLTSDLVTNEACITENIEKVPLIVNSWCDKLTEIEKGYERRSMYKEMTDAGYNVRQQIKELEQIYTDI